MKKNFTIHRILTKERLKLMAFLTIFHCQLATGQTFQVVSKTDFNLTEVINTKDPYVDYAIKAIFENTSEKNNVDSFFVWEKKILAMPIEWRNTVCDAQVCAGPTIFSQMFFKGGGKTAKLDVGFITMGVPGFAQVELTVYPENKKNLAKKFLYTATLNLPTGVEGTAGNFLNNNVYPNPTSGELYIDIKLVKATKLTILVKDISGKSIKAFTIDESQIINQKLDITDLTAGLYQLQYLVEGAIIKTISISKI